MRRRALQQTNFAKASTRDVMKTFQRRCGRTQHHGAYRFARAKHGHIARRITHTVLLLERGIVFFIDHDQAQTRQRRKHGEARADHNIGATGGGIEKPIHTRDTGETTMLGDDCRLWKTRRHLAQKLWGEVYFRHQHQRLLPT